MCNKWENVFYLTGLLHHKALDVDVEAKSTSPPLPSRLFSLLQHALHVLLSQPPFFPHSLPPFSPPLLFLLVLLAPNRVVLTWAEVTSSVSWPSPARQSDAVAAELECVQMGSR